MIEKCKNFSWEEIQKIGYCSVVHMYYDNYEKGQELEIQTISPFTE